jgi:Tfp pilus assembly protein PilV
MRYPLMTTDRRSQKAGISLLEVLISMGILTVGLLSVLALVPAGKSQAVKAVIYDRSSVMAANVAADLISRGLLRPSSWVTGTSAAPIPIAVFDPLYGGSSTFTSGTWPPQESSTKATTAITLRADAATTGTSATVISGSSANAALTGYQICSQAVCDILFRSEDDPRYTLDGVGPDDPPLPQWSAGTAAAPEGRRAFEGLYSFLATVQTSATAPPYWAPATPATLTIVAFQRRDPTATPVVLSPDPTPDTDLWVPQNLASDQKIKELIRPGSMVLWIGDATNVRWYRVVLASETPSGSVALTCEGGDPDSTKPAARVYVFPGAVSGLEIPVKLEGTSSWNR